MEWEIIDRPGYFGSAREEIYKRYNKEFGDGNWRIAWQWGELIIQKPEALLVYQGGYTEFLKASPNILEWLIQYKDVYDTAPSNMRSKFNYEIQETESNHLHDIAIRRAVVLDLGKSFKGKKGLLHVRPLDGEGNILNPHMVPFHKPELIYKGQIKYKGEERNFLLNPPWWLKFGIENSIEQFYQQNKVLEVKVK